ncbi:MAG: class I SAM-dependent methyltransferase [Candidatus Bathyarchaeia archaeon]|nr:methyltransferase [Candidatus Bathyarchaeota archaeon]
MEGSYEKKVFYDDFTFIVFNDVYEPAEDSFLIAENLEVNPNEDVIDIGAGCGILSIISAKKAKNVVAIDVSPSAVKCVKYNAVANGVFDKIDVIQGDLFGPLRKEALFDLVLFNAPYLPIKNEGHNSWIDYAWSGGATGRRIISRFIRDAPKHLKPNGRILLVQSTLSSIEKTKEQFMKRRFKTIVVNEKKVAFETISLLLAKRR